LPQTNSKITNHANTDNTEPNIQIGDHNIKKHILQCIYGDQLKNTLQ